MKFTKEQVLDYADKLLIGLSSEEIELILKEFNVIDDNMNKINEIPNISEVEPMTHALDNFEYTPREDKFIESPDIKELLQNCEYTEGREIEVPKVVG